MSVTDRPENDLTKEGWQEREAILDRFEHAWRQEQRPTVEDYLPAGGGPDLLAELIQTDLEYRLKAGEPARVEQYLARFPELSGDPGTLLELIAAEFELRQRREADLAPEEYGRRFPGHREGLLARLGEKAPVSIPGY